MGDTLLKIEDLKAFYGEAQVLWGVSMDISKNEIVTIIGSNGAGKTTLMRSVASIGPYSQGNIFFKNESIDNLSSQEIVLKGISLVPEGRRLFSGLTVRDNLLMGAYLKKKDEIGKNLNVVYQYFPILFERKSQLAGKLSGGEQQMCAIGRALMAAPELLLIDELSLGLAPIIIEKLMEIVKEIKKNGTTIVLVEQDVQVGIEMADRGYVLENGRVILEGQSEDLLNNPMIKEAYLGM